MKVIIILGGGLTTDNKLPTWVIDRCSIGIKIYQNDPDNFKFITASGGSYHNKPNVVGNFIEFESCVISQYLIDHGIPSNKILRESTSYDTVGNMYFIKTTITEPLNYKDLIIITSDFHIKRSKYLANFIFNLGSSYNIKYIETKTDVDIEILNKRLERENNSLNKFIENMIEVKTWSEFSIWLFTEHICYKPTLNKKEDFKPQLLYN